MAPPKPINNPAALAATMDRSMEKAQQLQELLMPTLNRPMPRNEVAEWANALAIQAGAVLAAMHHHGGIAPAFDERAAKSLDRYVRLGMKIGRQQ